MQLTTPIQILQYRLRKGCPAYAKASVYTFVSADMSTAKAVAGSRLRLKNPRFKSKFHMRAYLSTSGKERRTREPLDH